MGFPARVVFLCAIAGALVALVSRDLDAQLLTVRLRDPVADSPIAGAVLRIVRDKSTKPGLVDQALSDDSGTVRLRPAAGTVRVSVHRIGFEPSLSNPIVVEVGRSVETQLQMRPIRAPLPALTGEKRRQCRPDGSSSPGASLLWEDVRTALDATVLTQTQWDVPLRITTFRRELNLSGELRRQSVLKSVVARRPPIGALSPDSLTVRGFVVSSPRDVDFTAPDASLLLSDQFIQTHCFYPIPGAAGGANAKGATLGLRFESVTKAHVTDVNGTFWLDRATNELRSLEFSYVGLPDELKRAKLGGGEEFRRLGNGAWIVSHWFIRKPLLDRTPHELARNTGGAPGTSPVVGYVDEGGDANVPTGSEQPGYAYVVGRVFDSTMMRPLAGASVHLEGHPDSVVTDGAGRFVLSDDSGGGHRLIAHHAKLRLLADSVSREVSMSVGDTARFEIAVPSISSIVRQLCGVSIGQARGAFVGLVVSPTGLPVDGEEISIAADEANGPDLEVTESGGGGVFAFCDMPAGTAFIVGTRPRAEGSTPPMRPLVAAHWGSLYAGEFRWVDLVAARR
jgi:hypothetical protein